MKKKASNHESRYSYGGMQRININVFQVHTHNSRQKIQPSNSVLKSQQALPKYNDHNDPE